MPKKNQKFDIYMQIALVSILFLILVIESSHHSKLAFIVNTGAVLLINIISSKRMYLSFRVFTNNYVRIIASLILTFVVLVFFYEIAVIFFRFVPVI